MVRNSDTTAGRLGTPRISSGGPVSTAIRAVRAEHGADRELAVLRRALEARIQRDIELLDALDRGELA